MTPLNATPLAWAGALSNQVITLCDRAVGDRGHAPILLAKALVRGLELLDIPAAILYGEAAWVEIVDTAEGQPQIQWGGRWCADGAPEGGNTAESFHFWVETGFGEWVDLVAPAISRGGKPRARWSPPLLWSKTIPAFYKFLPHGQADVEFSDPQDRRVYQTLSEGLAEWSQRFDRQLEPAPEAFPNEAFLTNDQQMLDDAKQSFMNYDRALSVFGIPTPPPKFA